MRVRRERGGRKGKTVTTAGPFYLARDEANELLKSLKRERGSGGALREIRDSRDRAALSLEIQGDHADWLVGRLVELGFPTKRAGG